MTVVVLGLDPSTSMGWGIGTPKMALPTYGLCSLTDRGDNGFTLQCARNFLVRTIQEHGVTHIFREQLLLPKNSGIRSRIILFQLAGIIDLTAADHGVPVYEVNIGDWRKRFIGVRQAPPNITRDAASAKELHRRFELTPFARSDFEIISGDRVANEPDIVERARLTIFRSFAGFGSAAINGNHTTGFRSSSYRRGTTPVRDWMNFPKQVPAFVERMRGVVIENRPASSVIPAHDSFDTLFYVDPPYVHETRSMHWGNSNYAHEMSDDDHRNLAEILRRVKGMVILSGYACSLYDEELYPDWHRVERESFADGANKRVEVLWLNPHAVDAAARSPGPIFEAAS